MIYEDFDQVDQLEMEEMDLKWQMAMLSLRINRFEKKAGRKMNYNNQQPARFDRRKVRCYKCLQLGHFARECNVKTVDDKARYSAFKVTEVKTDEPKALVSVDSMVNCADASDAAAEFAMMGISPKAYQHAVKTLESQKEWYHKTQIALEEKIRVLSANLENTNNTLTYTEKLHDQAQKEKKEWEVKKYFGKMKCFDLSQLESFILNPDEKEVKTSLLNVFKSGKCMRSSPSITGTYMPAHTSHHIGKHSDNLSDSETHCNPVIQATRPMTKDPHLAVEDPDFCQRNIPAVNPAEKTHHPAGWSKRPATVSAGRPGDPSTDNDIGIVDSGCSRSMTGNKEKLDDFVQIKGGIVKFGGGDGRISGKGTIRTSKLDFENVYVDDIIFGSTNKAWCDEFEVLMKGEFEMSAMGEMTFFLGLQVKQLPDGLFISQDKYVKDMLTKFDMESVRTATTPYEAAKTKLKDETDPPVNVHLYRSMIGSLMYLTASRPDIMFAVSACSRHQVTPLTSHLNAVKKIFKYLKGQPKLGPVAKSNYVATSSLEAEYVAAAKLLCSVSLDSEPFCGLWFTTFMNTKILIADQQHNNIVKNPVFHQRTKHIEIRHHFIRDANEKNLIQVLKIHTDDNVADLLTKAFDGPRFAYLVVHIGMEIPLSLVSAGCTMILLVVIFPAARLVSAGCTMILLVVIFPAGRLVSAGVQWYAVVIFPADDWFRAGCTMICWYLSIPELEAIIVPAGFFVPAGSYGLCCW
ncbi:putative ribonuclease H-like domain-containing protein [Tanacetum coccineum]